MDCLVLIGLCKCLFNQLSFDFWNSVNDVSYETVEVVASQFNQVLLSVVVNKKEMKIGWSFSSRVTKRKISAVNVNAQLLSQKVISRILYAREFVYVQREPPDGFKVTDFIYIRNE